MLLRILSAVLLAPPLIYLILYGTNQHFFLLILPVAGGLLYEWQNLSGKQSRAKLLLHLSIAWLLLWVNYAGFERYSSLIIVTALFIMVASSLVDYQPDKKVIAGWSFDFVGLVYCIVPLILLLKINTNWSGSYVVFLLFVIWATDSGAYFSGKFFGVKKLAPKLSPGKTWVGFYGGCIGGMLAGFVGSTIFSFAFPLWQAILMGIIISLTGQLGDLAESLLKRESGIKDSGNLIPGHGGLLDRLDSVLFAAPVYYLLLTWLATAKTVSIGSLSFAG
ncbi:MAG: phosphatidate cytidylyltransferase [Magnetococcales bacterium]|nr:phosphatidate cytidylyltransferase [Magnetococcales bacterium]